MANPDEIPGSEGRNPLVRRGQRNVRRLAQTKIDWRGKGLRALHDYELRLREDFDAAAGDYSARCSIVRTFCALLDTRRILVGDPLPGTLRPSKQTTLEAWRESALPALPCPVSSTQSSTIHVSPVIDAVQVSGAQATEQHDSSDSKSSVSGAMPESP